jgi:hypothetical protein
LHRSIRLKHGPHTIFLLVDPAAPFSTITQELLSVLRERYPDGKLSTSATSPKTTTIPAEGNPVTVSYAILKNHKDIYSGWRDLKVTENDTLAGKKIGENTILAFAVHAGAEPDEDPVFEVDFPELGDPDAEMEDA